VESLEACSENSVQSLDVTCWGGLGVVIMPSLS